jgi:hypothetical protein
MNVLPNVDDRIKQLETELRQLKALRFAQAWGLSEGLADVAKYFDGQVTITDDYAYWKGRFTVAQLRSLLNGLPDDMPINQKLAITVWPDNVTVEVK